MAKKKILTPEELLLGVDDAEFRGCTSTSMWALGILSHAPRLLHPLTLPRTAAAAAKLLDSDFMLHMPHRFLYLLVQKYLLASAKVHRLTQRKADMTRMTKLIYVSSLN